MKTLLSKQNVPFTMVSNAVAQDSRLSFKAKGLYLYLYSKPDNWDFALDRITEETADKRDSVMSAIKELEANGLLRRTKNPTGRTTYWVTYPPYSFDEPIEENPQLGIEKPVEEKPNVGKTQRGKILSISKKDSTDKEREENKKDTQAIASGNFERGEVLKSFKDYVNPATKYNNTTQNQAVIELIELLGFARLIEVITHTLPISNKKAYMPNIQTPLQLLQKYSALESAISKHKDEMSRNFLKENPVMDVVNGISMKLKDQMNQPKSNVIIAR